MDFRSLGIVETKTLNIELLNSPIDPNLKRLIVAALRRYSMYWKPRELAVTNARVSRGNYKCNICKIDTFKRPDIQVDHIIPAVDTKTGLKNWYDLIIFIIGLYSSTENFQAICRTCHSIKSSGESKMRKFYRDEKKKDVSKDVKSLDKSKKK